MSVKSIAYKLYVRSKVGLNRLLDRIIDLSNLVLMDVYRLPWSAAGRMAKRIARYVGDVCWLLHTFPRVSAYRLTGAGWTIIFVGKDAGLREICELFFEEKADEQELGRVALWKLSAQTQKWLAEGTDLVVCELSRIHPRRPKAALTFTVAPWVQQVLAIATPLEALISGTRYRNVRHKVNKATKAGFNSRFSRSEVDFDYFYHRMYLPFVKARHNHLALVTPYRDQWQRWFTRGGLVLVTQHDQPVAGSLCYMANDTCFVIEMGVLDANPQLFDQEINAIVLWSAITWGHDQGARLVDLGGTHGWCSNGPFINKRRWGAHVVRRKRIYGTWTFLAKDLPPSLKNHLNNLGFITEIDRQFYRVSLSCNGDSMEKVDINQELASIEKQGLRGLAVIRPNSEPILHNQVS